MASSLQPHFDTYGFGIDVDVYRIFTFSTWDLVIETISQDNYRIIQFSKPSSSFDISNAGTLKLAASQARPYDECLRHHFLFCVRTYLTTPPLGAQTFSSSEVDQLEDQVGIYEGERPPESSDPVWKLASRERSPSVNHSSRM